MAGERETKVRKPENGVVRAVKFIPRLVGKAAASPHALAAVAASGAVETVCSGHCGRCRCNPCQLHVLPGK